LSFFISAVVGRFKDIRHIWNILLQLFFWLTPIVYPLKAIPERFRYLFVLNPFYHIIDGLRMSLIYSTNPSVSSYVITTLIGLAVLLTGFKLYRKLSKYFPEYI
jgi:ABC-type polysaccharide/polyol phosphate export permease